MEVLSFFEKNIINHKKDPLKLSMINATNILRCALLSLAIVDDYCVAFVLKPTTKHTTLSSSWRVVRKPSKYKYDSTFVRKEHFRTQVTGFNPQTIVYYSNSELDGFRNITNSNDFIYRTSNILAKRIVHRGFATMGLQLRRQREKEQLEDQKKQKEQLEVQKKKQKEESLKKNLEMKWDIAQINQDCNTEDRLSCSEPCETCRGKGVVTCQFCKGDGYVDFGQQTKGTVGGTMEKKNGGHTGIECPVCNEDGEQGCQKCNGSGWIALWKK